jgi:hypothetical protein
MRRYPSNFLPIRALHGLGSDASDCAAGNAAACQRYYAPGGSYSQDPSVVAANPGGYGTVQTGPGSGCSPFPPSQYAPPTAYAVQQVASTDPNVFTTPSYIKALNYNGMLASANDNNQLAWQQFSNNWRNWAGNGCVGSPPQAPVYNKVDQAAFDQYWNALTNGGTGFNGNVVPSSYGLPGGVGVSLVPTTPVSSPVTGSGGSGGSNVITGGSVNTTPPPGGASTGTGAGGSSGGKPPTTQTGSTGSTGSTGNTTPPATDSTLLYVGIGAAVLVAVMVLGKG